MSLDDRLREILDEDRPPTDKSKIKLIKQAFADEGYIQLNTDCSHRFAYTFCDMQHEGETCERCGLFRHMAKNAADSHVAPVSVMTGQEWYDRFEKEAPGSTEPHVFEAARKAAGL